MRLIILFLFSLFAFNCSTTSNCNKQSEPGYRIEAEKKYGKDNLKYSYNSDSTHVLIINQKKSTNLEPLPLLKFFIFDLQKNIAVFEESLPNAKVVWRNNNQVEVLIVPGIISKENPNQVPGYIFDIDLKRKIKLQSLINKP